MPSCLHTRSENIFLTPHHAGRHAVRYDAPRRVPRRRRSHREYAYPNRKVCYLPTRRAPKNVRYRAPSEKIGSVSPGIATNVISLAYYPAPTGVTRQLQLFVVQQTFNRHRMKTLVPEQGGRKWLQQCLMKTSFLSMRGYFVSSGRPGWTDRPARRDNKHRSGREHRSSARHRADMWYSCLRTRDAGESRARVRSAHCIGADRAESRPDLVKSLFVELFRQAMRAVSRSGHATNFVMSARNSAGTLSLRGVVSISWQQTYRPY